jgi:hypothetical protein
MIFLYHQTIHFPRMCWAKVPRCHRFAHDSRGGYQTGDGVDFLRQSNAFHQGFRMGGSDELITWLVVEKPL